MTLAISEASPISLNLPTLSIPRPQYKSQNEIAMDEFHEWIAGCWKCVVLRNTITIQTEYHFPEETIIIIPNK